MEKIKLYLRLFRVKHYIKNVLVLMPLFFGKKVFDIDTLVHALIGFVSFCLVSSAIYIFNDIQDIEKDRQHPTKRLRPIASGDVSKNKAIVCLILCLVLAIAISICVNQPMHAYVALIVYVVLNLGYSMKWKHIPLLEIAILVSGFLIRLLYGSMVTEIVVSSWLFMTVIAVSFYLGFGKRRNEWRMQQKTQSSDTRKVLASYSESFLNQSMEMFLCMSIIFYSLWAVAQEKQMLLWSIPAVMLTALRYSMRVERMDMSGDPVEMIYGDKVLWLLGMCCAIAIILGVYS